MYFSIMIQKSSLYLISMINLIYGIIYFISPFLVELIDLSKMKIVFDCIWMLFAALTSKTISLYLHIVIHADFFIMFLIVISLIVAKCSHRSKTFLAKRLFLKIYHNKVLKLLFIQK